MRPLAIGGGLAGAAVAASLFAAGREFTFERFERRDSTATDVAGAQRALSADLPVGTTLQAYESFFHSIGGRCAIVADTKRFPNTAVCTYSHGVLVTAEWRLVVRYDPTNRTSQTQELSFGLTGL